MSQEVIATKVKLSNGKIVTAYYLSKQGNQTFNEMLVKSTKADHYITWLQKRFDKYEAFFSELFHDAMLDYTIKDVIRILKTMDCSFHKSDLFYLTKYPKSESSFFEEAFQCLLDNEFMEKRGSGWYRSLLKINEITSRS